MQKRRVGIIGGGWSGAFAAKWLQDEPGVGEVVLYEASDDLGGAWRYHKASVGGVMRSTVTRASSSYMHPSDFPYPVRSEPFLTHDEVRAHFCQYVEKFGLKQCARLSTPVTRVYPRAPESASAAHTWVVEDAKGGREVFDQLIVATGQTTVAKDPRHKAPFKNFTGTVLHSSQFKHARTGGVVLDEQGTLSDESFWVGKQVVVIGGGESAASIVEELAYESLVKRVTNSIRHGTCFMDRGMGARAPVDQFCNRAVWFTGHYRSALIRVIREYFEGMWGYGGCAIESNIEPEAPVYRGMVNMNRNVLVHALRSAIDFRREVIHIDGRKVYFEDEEKPVEADILVFATGYDSEAYPFFLADGPACSDVDPAWTGLRHGLQPSRAYKWIFPPEYARSLAFVGTARPMVGSVTSLAELQARCVARLWSGYAPLPPVLELQRKVQLQKRWHADIYSFDHLKRPTLVSHHAYADDVADLVGLKPRLWREYFTSPAVWWLILHAPWSAMQFELNTTPARRELALQRIRERLPSDAHRGFMWLKYVTLIHVALFHLLLLCIVWRLLMW